MANPINPIVIELPIEEVTGYLEGLLIGLGTDCTIAGQSTKVMMSDLTKTYNNIEQNSKQVVVSKAVNVKRGDKVEFPDGRTAIVYTIPNDDVVSYSLRFLMCNSYMTFKRKGKDVYDENTGDLLVQDAPVEVSVHGFIEILSASSQEYDMGKSIKSNLRFTTFPDASIKVGDIALFEGREYDVYHIDDITEGRIVVSMRNRV